MYFHSSLRPPAREAASCPAFVALLALLGGSSVYSKCLVPLGSHLVITRGLSTSNTDLSPVQTQDNLLLKKSELLDPQFFQ